MIHNLEPRKPFVGLEGWLEFTLPTPQGAEEFRGLGQIECKASWEGIPVIHVNARGTSAKCSRCGNRMIPEENRQLHCPSCKHSVDRDVNRARNSVLECPQIGALHSGNVNPTMLRGRTKHFKWVRPEPTRLEKCQQISSG